MSGLLGLCAALLVVAAARPMRPLPTRRPPSPAAATVGRRRAGSVRTRRVAVGVTLFVAVALSVVVLGPLATGALAAGWVGWARLAPIRASRRRRARVVAALPDAIEMFVHAVHAGLTPRQAVLRLAQRAPQSVRHGFAAVVTRLERGDAFAVALRALDDALGTPAVMLSTLVGAADRDGLALGGVLEQLAAESRATRRRLDEAAARSLPVKLSFPLVVCTLPSFVVLAIVPAVMAALSSLGGAW